MIQKKELMIGNCFVDPKFPTLISVVEQLHDEYIVATYSDSLSYEQMEPIPLTPELLEVCGFIKDTHSGFGGWTGYISGLEQIRIVNSAPHGYNWPLYGSMPVWVNNLHQLQNLYFVLTGEDLRREVPDYIIPQK